MCNMVCNLALRNQREENQDHHARIRIFQQVTSNINILTSSSKCRKFLD